MPKYTVTVVMRQTLIASKVVQIEAPSFADAEEALIELAGMDDANAENYPDLIQKGMDVPQAVSVATIDPREVDSCETEVLAGDWNNGAPQVAEGGRIWYAVPGIADDGRHLEAEEQI